MFAFLGPNISEVLIAVIMKRNAFWAISPPSSGSKSKPSKKAAEASKQHAQNTVSSTVNICSFSESTG
jgi:hypothetical protein